MVEASAGKAILGRELSETESRVQGALVQGLTDEDVAYLDEFEGNVSFVRSFCSTNTDLGCHRSTSAVRSS